MLCMTSHERAGTSPPVFATYAWLRSSPLLIATGFVGTCSTNVRSGSCILTKLGGNDGLRGESLGVFSSFGLVYRSE